MRAVVFLLVLGNLIFFAYARGYFGSPPSPDRERLAQQLNPEKVVIVGRGEAPPAPAASPEAPVGVPPAAPATPAAVTAPPSAAPVVAAPAAAGDACLVWSPLGARDADTLASAVARLAPASALQRTVVKVPAERFFVRIAGLANKAAAEKKAGEVRRMEVEDFEVVADGELWAVALGLYSSAESAEARLAALRKKGVRSAVVQQRTVELERSRLQWHGPVSLAAELRSVLPQQPAAECAAGPTAEKKTP